MVIDFAWLTTWFCSALRARSRYDVAKTTKKNEIAQAMRRRGETRALCLR